jgi:hypothetical protein
MVKVVVPSADGITRLAVFQQNARLIPRAGAASNFGALPDKWLTSTDSVLSVITDYVPRRSSAKATILLRVATICTWAYRWHRSRWRLMTIRRLLKDSNLTPEETQRLCLAYKSALRSLHLVDRNDPIAELVAKKIIEIRIAGVRDPAEICKVAVKRLGAE